MIRRLVSVLAIAAMAPLILATSSHAVTAPAWTASNAGGGGALNSPVVSASGAWAVGSDLSGSYVSTTKGGAWSAIGSAVGLPQTHVSAQAFHADGRLFLGTDDGLFITNTARTKVTKTLWAKYIAAIAMTSDPNVVYAVAQADWNQLKPQVWRSPNGGANWEQIATDLPQDLRITAIRVHPADPKAIMVVSAEGRWPENQPIPSRVYLSNNQGRNFSRVDPNAGEVYDVRYDLTSPNRVWLTTGVGSGGALYRSENAGWTWTRVSTGRSGAIWLDKTNAARIRLVEVTAHDANDAAGGVWQSTNSGASFSQFGSLKNWAKHWPGWDWSYAESFQGLLQTIGFSDTDPNVAIWVTTQWAFASTDGGKTFRSAMGSQVAGGGFHSTGLDNIVPFGVAPSPADPKRIYSYNWDIGCQRSDDAGGSWKNCNQTWLGSVRLSEWEENNGGDVYSMAADPTRRDTVWAAMTADKSGNAARLVRSDKAGETGSWMISDWELPRATYVGGLSIMPGSPTTARVMFVVADGSVYRSTNDGWNWAWVNGCQMAGTSDCEFTWAVGNGVVFAGGGAGLFRSTADGAAGTWTKVGGTTLEGDPWAKAWWLDWYKGVSDVAVDPRNANRIWVTKFGDGLYRSDNGGTSFVRVKADQFIRAVLVEPTGKLWTGSSSATYHGGWQAGSNGAMTSTDDGRTWTAANEGLAWPFVLDLARASDGTIWGAHAGLGNIKR